MSDPLDEIYDGIIEAARTDSSFAAAYHVDPCKRCRRMFFRSDMVKASKVRVLGLPPKKGARGYFCRECTWKSEHVLQKPLIEGL